MSEFKFINRLPEFAGNVEKAADEVIQMAAFEIERMAKMIAPQKTSVLMNSIRTKKIANAHWQVSAGQDPFVIYAAFQHRGARMDGSHAVTKYSKPGSQKEYILAPAIEVYNTKYVQERIGLLVKL